VNARVGTAPRAVLIGWLLSACGPSRDVLLGDGTGAATCSPGTAIPESTSALLRDAVGFGRAANGGLGGCLYHVTTLADAGPGTLREGLARPEPLWIVFDLSGTIELLSNLDVASKKTIDGRGRAVTLHNGGLIIEGQSHVVVENLAFDGSGLDPVVFPATDAITVLAGSHDIWIDHSSFSTYPDGQVDITQASTDVTVSWCRFQNHVKVMLISSNAEATADTVIRVTLHHNWFDQTDYYHPRLRFGKAHTFDNFYDRWGSAGIAVAMGGEIASENNIFAAATNTDALLTQAGTDPLPGLARSTGDWLLGGAVVVQTQPDVVFSPAAYYAYRTEVADDALRTSISSGAGPR
jgi:pectate lyase